MALPLAEVQRTGERVGTQFWGATGSPDLDSWVCGAHQTDHGASCRQLDRQVVFREVGTKTFIPRCLQLCGTSAKEAQLPRGLPVAFLHDSGQVAAGDRTQVHQPPRPNQKVTKSQR